MAPLGQWAQGDETQVGTLSPPAPAPSVSAAARCRGRAPQRVLAHYRVKAMQSCTQVLHRRWSKVAAIPGSAITTECREVPPLDGPTAVEIEALRLLSRRAHRVPAPTPPGRPTRPSIPTAPEQVRSAQERSDRRMRGVVSALQRAAERERTVTEEIGSALSSDFAREVTRCEQQLEAGDRRARAMGQPLVAVGGIRGRAAAAGLGRRARGKASRLGANTVTMRHKERKTASLPGPRLHLVDHLPSRRARRHPRSNLYSPAARWIPFTLGLLIGLVVMALLYEFGALATLVGAPRL